MKTLYRYRPLGLNVLESLVTDHHRYSNPIYFNDPFDFWVRVTWEGSLEDLKTKIYSIVEKKLGEGEAEAEFALIDYQVKNHAVDERDCCLFSLSQFLRAQIKNIGVLSFSEKNDSILMWSHYADGHKGICIEYEIDDEREILYKVNYTSHKVIDLDIVYEYIVNNDEVAKRTLLEKILLVKSGEWEHEEEWRIVESVAGDRPSCTCCKVKKIYFGLRCPQYAIAIIVKTMMRDGADVKFYRMNVDDSGVGLAPMEVDTDSVHEEYPCESYERLRKPSSPFNS